MRKEVLESLVKENLTQRQMAVKLGVAQISVRYWLNKHGLATNHQRVGIPRNPSIPRKCVGCGETDPRRFYGRRWNYCKPCDNERSIKRFRENRDYALTLLGGHCRAQHCGIREGFLLDIHHTDATLKDPAFARMCSWSRDRIRRELETCVLLCKNHHAREHARLRASIV